MQKASPMSDKESTNRPHFYGSRDVVPPHDEGDWNHLALAAARQALFRQSFRVVWNCHDGHQHDTAEAAAKCIAAARIDDVDGDWAE